MSTKIPTTEMRNAPIPKVGRERRKEKAKTQKIRKENRLAKRYGYLNHVLGEA
jgi:hypothetical protein